MIRIDLKDVMKVDADEDVLAAMMLRIAFVTWSRRSREQ